MNPEPIYKVIGGIIRQRRRRLDWSQGTLASRLGISRATLANIETGRQRILVHHLYAFGDVLGAKPSDFLPLVSVARGGDEWTELPMPGDLKRQQKEQIGRLIGTVKVSTSKSKETSGGTPAKGIIRGSR